MAAAQLRHRGGAYVLRDAAAAAWSEVGDSPGRRGNPAKREQAKRDQKDAFRLSEDLEYPLVSFGRCVQHRQPYCYWQVDEVPALGISGWHFVETAAPGWTGLPVQLFAVGVAAGEPPLDMGAWKAWRCSNHWLRLLREAKDREHVAGRRARPGVRNADRIGPAAGSAIADADWREAAALRRRHLQLQREVLQHEQVLRLDPPSIVTLTRLVDRGRSLTEALTEVAHLR